jgi:acetyl esterase/lipase
MKAINHPLFVAVCTLLFCTAQSAVADTKKKIGKGSPSLENVSYGEHPRQVLDFYQAESNKPTPLVFYIHGGAWVKYDKTLMWKHLKGQRLLDNGISIVSINYRYLEHADDKEAPVSAPLNDAARALQFVRSKAKEWNFDPEKIGASGTSAGAFSSLWLAFHDDMADPKSTDPISRESTRLFCVAANLAQTTLDPELFRKWTPNCSYGGHAFGLKYGDIKEFEPKRRILLPLIEKYSPYSLVSQDDPPVYLIYNNAPALGEPRQDPTHSANYGLKLQEHCQDLEVPCELVYPGAANVVHPSMEDYFISMFGK